MTLYALFFHNYSPLLSKKLLSSKGWLQMIVWNAVEEQRVISVQKQAFIAVAVATVKTSNIDHTNWQLYVIRKPIVIRMSFFKSIEILVMKRVAIKSYTSIIFLTYWSFSNNSFSLLKEKQKTNALLLNRTVKPDWNFVSLQYHSKSSSNGLYLSKIK